MSLLTGGRFHSKSTLLEATELGIYDHIPGDGRDFVVTDLQPSRVLRKMDEV